MSEQTLIIKLVSSPVDTKKRQKKSARFQSGNQKNQNKSPPPYLPVRPHHHHPDITRLRLIAETCGFKHLPFTCLHIPISCY